MICEHLAALRDIYQIMIDRRPPESEEGFLRWVLEEPTMESPDPPTVSLEALTEERPDTRRAARSLAEQQVLLARAEALDALGERNAGVRLVEKWVRRPPGDERDRQAVRQVGRQGAWSNTADPYPLAPSATSPCCATMRSRRSSLVNVAI